MSEDELHPHLPLFHAPPIPSQPTFSPRSLGILESGCSSRSTIIITSSSPRPHLVLTSSSLTNPCLAPNAHSAPRPFVLPCSRLPSPRPRPRPRPPPSLLPASSQPPRLRPPRLKARLAFKQISFSSQALSWTSGCRGRADSTKMVVETSGACERKGEWMRPRGSEWMRPVRPGERKRQGQRQ